MDGLAMAVIQDNEGVACCISTKRSVAFNVDLADVRQGVCI
jgi:hypothetical protein